MDLACYLVWFVIVGGVVLLVALGLLGLVAWAGGRGLRQFDRDLGPQHSWTVDGWPIASSAELPARRRVALLPREASE